MLLCKKIARAPGGHKRFILTKLGRGAKQNRSVVCVNWKVRFSNRLLCDFLFNYAISCHAVSKFGWNWCLRCLMILCSWLFDYWNRPAIAGVILLGWPLGRLITVVVFDVLQLSCNSSLGNFCSLPHCLITLIVLTIASICAITKCYSSYIHTCSIHHKY